MFPDAKLFRDIVQQRSISRGARLNRISQSAASQQIQELERRLKVQLLDRTTRPVNATPAGKLYSELCRDICCREEEFIAGLEALQSNTEGRVRIASIYSVGLSEIPRHREEFLKRFPKVDLVLDLCRPDAVYTALLEDRVDLGLVSYPEATKELTVLPWRDEPMSVVLPPDHPLSTKTSISAADLNGLSFIAFDEDLAIRRYIDRYLGEHGAQVNVTLQVDNIQTLKACLGGSQEISILPTCTVSTEVAQQRLVAIALAEPLLRPVGIVYRRRKTLNRAAQLFIDRLLSSPEPPRPSVDRPRPASALRPEAVETVDVSGSGGSSNPRG